MIRSAPERVVMPVQTMKFGRLYCTKLGPYWKLNKLFKNVIKRNASNGIDSFSEPFTTDLIKRIEKHWKNKIPLGSYDETNTTKEKFYALSMFPYPSGKLHMGHVRVYTISDTIAHYYRMKGYNVLHPIGWDSFGLPAENAAIERQVDPAEWTDKNISEMRNQLQMLNYSFDWQRELSTSSPEYYKWTQELFLKLYEKGLVYQTESYVNWDPIDETVLAEEQVSSNNTSWRSGAKVEKKLLKQWYIRTTAFSEALARNLNNPEITKHWKDIPKIQAHWIGKCNGTTMNWQLSSNIPDYPKTIELWTDLPEFIEYAKFIVISPDSLMNKPTHTTEVTPNIKQLDAKVTNPFTGIELPVFVTNELNFPEFRDNYLGIPAANMEDYKFLEKVGLTFERHTIRLEAQRIAKRNEVLTKAKEWKIGGYCTSSRSKDWLISRQRYWGTPIPLVHCDSCGIQPVPHDQLPVVLPKIAFDYVKKAPTLDHAEDWLKTTCPKCGQSATREADTMDTFVDSSWYFLRYIDPHNKKEMFSTDKINKSYPVDIYIGGKEHGAMHLYYARFISHFLHSEGLLPNPEPFIYLLTQGMVKGKTYKVKETGKYLPSVDVIEREGKYFEKGTEAEVLVDWKKMSKSKHNGVDPLHLLESHGIDTTRLLILGDVTPFADRKWSLDSLRGIHNWENRIWKILKTFLESRKNVTLEELQQPPTDPKFAADDAYAFDSRNFFLKKVTNDITSSFNFNTAISRMNGFTNSLYKVSPECIEKSINFERALATQIIILAPLAPHFGSELWYGFCSAKHHLIDRQEVDLNKDVLQQKWPKIDMDYNMVLNVFVNGTILKKIRLTQRELEVLTVPTALDLLQSEPKLQAKYDLDKAEVNLTCKPGYDGLLHIRGKKKQSMQNQP